MICTTLPDTVVFFSTVKLLLRMKGEFGSTDVPLIPELPPQPYEC